MAQPSASPDFNDLAGKIWQLEIELDDLKFQRVDTTKKEAELTKLLLLQEKRDYPEPLADTQQPAESTQPNMAQQTLQPSVETQQHASAESRKRVHSEDDSSAIEPPHKSRRVLTPPFWGSDDDDDDDNVNGVINRPSSMVGTQVGDTAASNEADGEEFETPAAIQCSLYKHQLIALQWMTKQERDENKKGGILADDMGLGKTLTTISLMVSRKAKQGSSAKTNLIVAPVALLRQWQREIEQKVKPEHRLSVFIVHGNAKADYTQLRSYDVVLTTYGKITSEYSKMDQYIRKAKDEKRNVKNEQLSKLFPILGPLSMYHRIILDEAQCIKNPKSKGSKAASQLKGHHRWCLTGTPMMNGPKELAALVHFLKIQPYDNVSLFLTTFKSLDPKSKSRDTMGRKRALNVLRALLSNIMLRRTKDQKIDGKPIVDLKEKVLVVDYAVFDDDERDFYRTLEKHSRVEFSKYFLNRGKGKNITKILTLLLRLRQACCHPHLHLLDVECAGPDISDDNLVGTAKSLTPEIVERVKEAENFECSACLDVRSRMNIISPCGDYICTPCVDAAIELTKQQNIAAGIGEGSAANGHLQCPKCMVNSKIVTYDAFAEAHLPQENGDNHNYDISDTDDDDDGSGDDDIDIHGNLKGFVVDDDADDDYVDDSVDDYYDLKGEDTSNNVKIRDGSIDTKKRGGSKNIKREHKYKIKEKKPLQLAELRDKARNSQKAHKRYMKELRKILLPSSKVTKCLEIISTIQKTTGEKIIVFSQWTFLLDILEVFIIDHLKIRVCRFDGSMSATDRDDSANEFTTNPEAKVILTSLKAGNAGLNLTAASQVILMDPFWNPYIENQAIDRAYRIGQQREVTVHRILVKETVEDRIVSIQDQKRQIVESALSNEKASKSMASLGADELAYIFGMKRH